MRDETSEARSFGRAAPRYDRSRPGYPDEAVEWLIPDSATAALDLGAGTGKLARALAARGLEVFAVDPSAQMLSVLDEAQPRVRTMVGRAEEIPLADASVDLVAVAQAWHWVDRERATAEAARVLRPGGVLALVWNLRDERVDWMRRLCEIVPRIDAEPPLEGGLEIGPPFGPTESLSLDWTMPLTVDGALELIGSLSPVIVASEERRAAMLEQARGVLATAGAGRGVVDFPYRTRCFRARVPAPGPA